MTDLIVALLGGALVIDSLDEPPAVPEVPSPIPPRVASSPGTEERPAASPRERRR